MLFIMKNGGENEDTATDACKLVEAWEVRSDKARYRRATDFIKAQSSLFSTFVKLQEAELSDPF
jgi:hypothetical protein